MKKGRHSDLPSDLSRSQANQENREQNQGRTHLGRVECGVSVKSASMGTAEELNRADRSGRWCALHTETTFFHKELGVAPEHAQGITFIVEN